MMPFRKIRMSNAGKWADPWPDPALRGRAPRLLSRWMGRSAFVLVVAISATACTSSADEPEPETTTTSTTTSTTVGSAPSPTPPVYLDPDAEISDRVEDLLGRMTLAEKIGQMTLVEKNSIDLEAVTEFGIGGVLSGGGGSPEENTPAGWAGMVEDFQTAAMASRLGVPLIYGVDAVHGHNNVPGAVIFPHNIGLGAANDPDLMTRIGEVTASEMIATGIYWNYAPAVSVPHDIRWGRTYEGYSEETDLVTDLATAYLSGLQGTDLGDASTVLGTPKHYVGDGGTAWGTSTTENYRIDQGVTLVDEETLRAVHLPPYRAAIEAGARSIMVSYSSWIDLKMHAHRYLITDVLKEELGFGGFVVSDWGGITQISDDFSESVTTAINAGIDMNMVPSDYRAFIRTLTEAVEAGDVDVSRIDDAVSRILTVKFELRLFERPHGDDSLLDGVGSDGHRAVAREAVAKSQVLLRNEGGLLPLDPEMETIYVGGGAADNIGIQSGGWTIEWQGASGPITEGTSILEGIRATVSEATEVVYDGSGEFGDTAEPTVCLAVVGEFPYAEGIGDDPDLRLPASDEVMLEQMRAQCGRLAVVILSGRPLIVTESIDSWDSVVAAWLPGSEGQGVADVLFGIEPFTGKLPYTWPKSVDQLPLDPESGFADPLFPNGHGLEG
jgi:beta-glucosidase